MPPKGEVSVKGKKGTSRNAALGIGDRSGRRLLQLHKSDDFTNAAFNKLTTPRNVIAYRVSYSSILNVHI